MIRPFDWRDVALLHRVHRHGICMYARMGCTSGPNALMSALREMLSMGRRACTVVYRPDAMNEQAAVGQLCHGANDQHARLAFIGPAEVLSHPNAVHLIDALVETAGARGAHHLLAEVPEDSHAFEALRHASFAIYARQRIWRLDSHPPTSRMQHSGVWRSMSDGDTAAVQALYHSLVPPLVQQIEPPPSRDRGGLLHWDQDELNAYLQIQRGPLGTWVQPFFRPSVDNAEAPLSSLLRQFRIDRHRPLYLCVRSYHGSLNGLLERLGFKAWQDQAVMVKHLVAKVRKPVLSPLRAIEGTRPEPTSPIMRTEDRRSGSRVSEGT